MSNKWVLTGTGASYTVASLSGFSFISYDGLGPYAVVIDDTHVLLWLWEGISSTVLMWVVNSADPSAPQIGGEFAFAAPFGLIQHSMPVAIGQDIYVPGAGGSGFTFVFQFSWDPSTLTITNTHNDTSFDAFNSGMLFALTAELLVYVAEPFSGDGFQAWFIPVTGGVIQPVSSTTTVGAAFYLPIQIPGTGGNPVVMVAQSSSGDFDAYTILADGTIGARQTPLPAVVGPVWSNADTLSTWWALLPHPLETVEVTVNPDGSMVTSTVTAYTGQVFAENQTAIFPSSSMSVKGTEVTVVSPQDVGSWFSFTPATNQVDQQVVRAGKEDPDNPTTGATVFDEYYQPNPDGLVPVIAVSQPFTWGTGMAAAGLTSDNGSTVTSLIILPFEITPFGTPPLRQFPRADYLALGGARQPGIGSNQPSSYQSSIRQGPVNTYS